METKLLHANELNTSSKSIQTGNMGLDLCSIANLPHVRHLMAPAVDSSGSDISIWILHQLIKATGLLEAQLCMIS